VQLQESCTAIQKKTRFAEKTVTGRKFQNEFPGRNPEKFGNFSRFFPGPLSLPFKLFNLFISLRSKEINRLLVLWDQS